MDRLISDKMTSVQKYYARLTLMAISGCLLLVVFLAESCFSLELRQIQNNSLTETGTVIPDDAIQVFVYAGDSHGIKVSEDSIVVDYGRCGIVYSRKDGKRKSLFDVADGWPEIRPEQFKEVNLSRSYSRFVGPGILTTPGRIRAPRGQERLEFEEACSVEFEGRTWRAYQPAGFLDTIWRKGYDDRTGPYSTWSGILAHLNKESFIQVGAPGQNSKRYTMSSGLASNIVTRLVTSQGSLWASCVDIYEPKKKRWGPGGLSRFDPKTNRWEHIKTINGHTVRWVTLMETIGNELWIGFREGNEVEGDKVTYGMGVGVDIYRPKTLAIMLARLAEGKWTVFTKSLSFTEGIRDNKDSPTQMPIRLAGSSERVFLFCGYDSAGPAYNYEYKLDGYVSSLDCQSGKWRSFDLYKDFEADRLIDMLGDKNEILVASNRGVHRWENTSKSWKYLDPQTQLKNPSISTVARRNNELWFGYTNQSFGVIGKQGISIFDEENLKWSYISPEQIGTGCPIRRISVMMNGDVWILFEKRPNRGAAEEFPFYPREANIFFQESGVGCFRKGKWIFPIEFPGFFDDNDYHQTVHDMVAIGDKLFIAGRKGVYLGPDQWQRIIEGDIMRIEASADGKSLIILRQGPRSSQNSSTFQRGQYDLATGKISFEVLPYEGLNMMQLDPPSYLWEYNDIGSEDSRLWAGEWVLLPKWKEGNWVIGPMGSNGYHGVIETPNAFWIASQGELVRLDRISMRK